MAAYDSLQQSVTGEILLPKPLLKFANSEIPGIQSFLVPITKVLKNKHLLEKRLEKSNSLPGSRSDHFLGHLQTLWRSQCLLGSDEEAVPFNISNFVIHDLKVGDNVACTYEFDWYADIFFDNR